VPEVLPTRSRRAAEEFNLQNVMYIGDDVIIGIVKDAMDVEYLRVYQLVKPNES
jgi:hypothetical protein